MFLAGRCSAVQIDPGTFDAVLGGVDPAEQVLGAQSHLRESHGLVLVVGMVMAGETRAVTCADAFWYVTGLRRSSARWRMPRRPTTPTIP